MLSCSAKKRSIAKSGSKNRLRVLAEIFAIPVSEFSVMDNRLHVLVRLDPEVTAAGRVRTLSGARVGSFRRATSFGSLCR